MKLINSLSKRVEAFTLIELLVVISIIAILASLALPAITGALVKGQISQTVSNYRQLYVLTQSASLDNLSAGGQGAFPGDLTGGVSGWSNTLTSNNAYCTTTTLAQLVSVKGSSTNSQVWTVKSSDEPSSVFVATAGISASSPTNFTLGSTGPYSSKGGAIVTVNGQALNILGASSPALTNGSISVASNSTASSL